MKFCLALVLVVLCASALAHPHHGGGRHHGGGGRHHRGGGDSSPVPAPFDFKSIRQCRVCNFSSGEVFCAIDSFKFDSDGACQPASAPCTGSVISSAVGCPTDVPRSKSSCTACVLDGYVWSSSSDSTSEYAGKCVASEDVQKPQPPTTPPVPPTTPPVPPADDSPAPPAPADAPAPPAGTPPPSPPPPPAEAPPVPPAGSPPAGTPPPPPPPSADMPSVGPADELPPNQPRPQHRRHPRDDEGENDREGEDDREGESEGEWNEGGQDENGQNEPDMPPPPPKPTTIYTTTVEQCQAFLPPPPEATSGEGEMNGHGFGHHRRGLRILHHIVFAVAIGFAAICVIRCIRKRRCCRPRGHRSHSSGVPASSPASFVEQQLPTVAPAAPQVTQQPVASAPPAPLPSYVYPGTVPASVPYAAYYPVNQYAAAAPAAPVQPVADSIYPAMGGRVARNGYMTVAQNDS